MKSTKLIAASALAIAATCGVASAQALPEGRVYDFDSRARGACPAADWHVVVGANDALSGVITWDNMKAMAHATGKVNPANRTFQMTAVRVDEGGKGNTATIDGTVRQDGWMIANIKGPKINCQGVQIPWYTPNPAGQGG
jgi:hypothetical protein